MNDQQPESNDVGASQPLWLEAMSACLDSADSLLNSARAVRAVGHHNVAFHLVVLALEEIGKRSLLQVRRAAEIHGHDAPWIVAHSVDHVQKLWWCFFGVMMERERLTQELLESFKVIAGRLHDQRMGSVYVELTDKGVSVPHEAVTPEDCDRLIEVATVRLAVAREDGIGEFSADDLEIQRWYVETNKDPVLRRQFFTRNSLDKLAEMGSVVNWLRWHRAEIDAQQERMRAITLAAIEQSRQQAQVGGIAKKWRVRIKLQSDTHTVRANRLTNWNNQVDWIRLEATHDREGLFVEFTLPSSLSVDALYHRGWGLGRQFAAALSIASSGLWWWSFPAPMDQYAESVRDLENDYDVMQWPHPQIRGQWGRRRSLTDEDLQRVLLVMTVAHMPRRPNEDADGLDHYMEGLVYLSKNDLHLECHGSALRQFFLALAAFMVETGEATPETIEELMLGLIGILQLDAAALERLTQAVRTLASGAHLADVTTQVSDAFCMKVICDSYFIGRVAPRRIQSSRARQRDNPVAPSAP